MYVPTMPDDNLLEVMTAMPNAKLYGKLMNWLYIVVIEVNDQNISLSYHMRHPYWLFAACPKGHAYAIGNVSNVCLFINITCTVYMCLCQ